MGTTRTEWHTHTHTHTHLHPSCCPLLPAPSGAEAALTHLVRKAVVLVALQAEAEAESREAESGEAQEGKEAERTEAERATDVGTAARGGFGGPLPTVAGSVATVRSSASGSSGGGGGGGGGLRGLMFAKAAAAAAAAAAAPAVPAAPVAPSSSPVTAGVCDTANPDDMPRTAAAAGDGGGGGAAAADAPAAAAVSGGFGTSGSGHRSHHCWYRGADISLRVSGVLKQLLVRLYMCVCVCMCVCEESTREMINTATPSASPHGKTSSHRTHRIHRTPARHAPAGPVLHGARRGGSRGGGGKRRRQRRQQQWR